MDISPDTVLNFFAFAVTGIAALGFNAWAIIRYLDNRREAGDKELHSRINLVRQEYVDKAQYEKDRQQTQREFDRIQDTVADGFKTMTERLDKILGLFANGNKGG